MSKNVFQCNDCFDEFKYNCDIRSIKLRCKSNFTHYLITGCSKDTGYYYIEEM